MSRANGASGRIPVLYLAPWVDFGGTDTSTIDWFRWLDRSRFAPSLITTQPSRNRRLGEIFPFAEEVWPLPDHLPGPEFASFIFDFIHTRGVQLLHVMNSRLGFDLLPDLEALDNPPAVVVQLHVEEPDRSGYVRYVTTRYGNLVDGFSLSSGYLAQAVEGYDVAAGKLHTIPTGVDARGEFNPELVVPIERERGPGEFNIVWAGRLTDQKDPLLALKVLHKVVSRHDNVRVDVLGEGPLEHEVRAALRDLHLERHVRMHPPTTELPRWLRSADLMLMTSEFEGVPVVVYNALALGLPVVAPALPGIAELIVEGAGGTLVEPRDDADAYAAAVGRLADDETLRRELGAAGRARMLESFSLRDMAARHERIYEQLLEGRRFDARAGRAWRPPALRLSRRPGRGTPLVTVVTPCFNHGRHLVPMLETVFEQDYPAVEVIVVDDASTDSETLAVMDDLERDGRVRVLRQPRNSGPSAARNRAIAEANGRHILPVDSDNLLLPGSIRMLVDQLQAAGERVGYVYPAYTYFGNRDYTFEPPDYNMFSLLQTNFADTCSLIDRDVFDAGFRYPEDFGLGHEDWDLALALAARDVIGIPSQRPVILYRKHGFTRSDRVEYRRSLFRDELRARRPELYGYPSDWGAFGAFSGSALDIKRRWSPALSIVSLAPIDLESEPGARLLTALAAQSCGDFELVVDCPAVPSHTTVAVRRLPSGLVASEAERARETLTIARGRYVLVTSAVARLAADPTVVEKLVRELWSDERLGAIAFADPPADDGHPYPLRSMAIVDGELAAHSVCWRLELGDRLGATVTIGAGGVADSLTRALHEAGANVRWRQLAGVPAAHGPATVEALDPRPPAPRSPAAQRERADRMRETPGIPALEPGVVRRWISGWTPGETLPLFRHVRHDGSSRAITHDHISPPGYRLEFHLGSIQHFSPPGTVRLVHHGGSYLTIPRGSSPSPDAELLGYLEEAPLPMWLAIHRVQLPDGSETLVQVGPRDPLQEQARNPVHLGYIEPFPIEPLRATPYSVLNLPVLVRRLDDDRRRHTYGAIEPVGGPAEIDDLSAELGQLATAGTAGTVPLYLDASGRISTPGYDPPSPSPSLEQIGRWALAPAAWQGFGSPSGRARSIARRTLDSPLLALRARTPHRGRRPERRLLGYLHSEPASNRLELLSAIHPILGDQFLTHHAIEATDMGYDQVTLLGYVSAAAPLTGVIGGRRLPVTWGSRFGMTARGGPGPKEFR